MSLFLGWPVSNPHDTAHAVTTYENLLYSYHFILPTMHNFTITISKRLHSQHPIDVYDV